MAGEEKLGEGSPANIIDRGAANGVCCTDHKMKYIQKVKKETSAVVFSLSTEGEKEWGGGVS